MDGMDWMDEMDEMDGGLEVSNLLPSIATIFWMAVVFMLRASLFFSASVSVGAIGSVARHFRVAPLVANMRSPPAPRRR